MDELDKRHPDYYDEEYWEDMVKDDLLWLCEDNFRYDIKDLESIKQASMRYENHKKLGEKAKIISDIVGRIEDTCAEMREVIWDLYKIAK